ncbi:MAG: aminopeptidase, partial [Saccharofermentanales bacterium]
MPEQKNSTSTSKAKTKDLKKRLFAEYKNIWETATIEDKDYTFAFAEDYKRFLDLGKTERECVLIAIEACEELGFVDYEKAGELKPGMKVYQSVKGKGVLAAVIGRQDPKMGFNLLGAHIDAPRVDLKPCPIYEEDELVFLKTHYYGGIKKYQWVSIPLAIHGIVMRSDGSKVT